MNAPFTTLISTTELAELMAQSNPVILDCRFSLVDVHAGRVEYLQAHIPGAYYLDLNHTLSSPVVKGVTGRHPLPHPDVLATTLRACGLEQHSQVVVYDQLNGAYASRAWWLLNWLGHDNVAVLDGGFTAWQNEEHPVDNQWYAPQEGGFQPRLNEALTVDRDFVHQTDEKVVDSRAYERYTGETEPLDPVAGHIKGATCLPFAKNLDTGHHWKPVEALRQRFAEAGLLDIDNPIFYCGSGVTACHNILAYKIVTGRDARLYPGSWSEYLHYYPAATGA